MHRKSKILPAMRPNHSLEVIYRKRLYKLIDGMHTATRKLWIPNIATDMAFDISKEDVLRLQEHWKKVFADQADPLADFVITDGYKFNTRRFMKLLRDAGFAVSFQMTPEMQRIFDGAIYDNVNLIKSIPNQYFSRIRDYLEESVLKGQDLHTLTNKLEALPGVTRRQAALIAQDQNQKMTSRFNQARYSELGINQAVWNHSHGGNEPRPTHLKNDQKVYNVVTGWWDPHEGKHIQPGELINCKCFSRPVLDI
jgi:uncharacterized protein with gpF-like domain